LTKGKKKVEKIKSDPNTKHAKWIKRAKELDMVDALLITPKDITFDIRTWLKCRWGCESSKRNTVKCNTRETTLDERQEIIKKYKAILLVHSHDRVRISEALLELEKEAFLDGHYFAFALRYCNYCKNCMANNDEHCPHPDMVRPCEQLFGIDVYKTVRDLGLPINVLQDRGEQENRYGFLLIE